MEPVGPVELGRVRLGPGKKTHLINKPGPSQGFGPASRVRVWKILSRTQPIAIPNNSHWNIVFLNAELQANLARNKANTWLNKFNLTVFFFPTNYLTSDFLFEFIFTLTMALVTDVHVRILWDQPSSNSKDWCQSFELNIANVIFGRGFAVSFEHWFWCDVLMWFGIVVLIWNCNILAYK